MKALKNNATFFIVYLLALTLGIGLVGATEKPELFLMLNSYHTPLLDAIMPYYTQLGSAFFPIFLLGLCNKHRFTPQQYMAAYYLLGGMVILALVFLLKAYYHEPRPLSYLVLKPYFKPVGSAPLLYWNSFPSGHTTTIFYAVTSYLLVNRYNKLIQFAFVLLALSVGYSRIYVWAHFLEDVIAGSYLGIMVPVILYSFFYKKIDEIYTK